MQDPMKKVWGAGSEWLTLYAGKVTKRYLYRWRLGPFWMDRDHGCRFIGVDALRRSLCLRIGRPA